MASFKLLCVVLLLCVSALLAPAAHAQTEPASASEQAALEQEAAATPIVQCVHPPRTHALYSEDLLAALSDPTAETPLTYADLPDLLGAPLCTEEQDMVQDDTMSWPRDLGGGGVVPPPPETGDYAISNPIPAVDVTTLNYTMRDWSRWDGFDRDEDLLYTPTQFASPTVENEGSRVWGIGNGRINTDPSQDPSSASARLAPSDGTPTAAKYLRAVQRTIEQIYLPRGYGWYRGYQRNVDLDFVANFRRLKRLDMWSILLNTSFALNENYNVFRAARKATIKTSIVTRLQSQGINPLTYPTLQSEIDTTFDSLKINWQTDMPRNKATLDWLETYLDAVLNIMCLKQGTWIPRDTWMGPYDAFGLFAGMDGAGYNPLLMHFYSGDWAFVSGHYLKHLSTSMIRRIRASMYASLSAQYAVWVIREGVGQEDRLTNQWMLRLTGYTNTAYTLLRSEAVLKQRGLWTTADTMTRTNWTLGLVTNADLLTHMHSELDRFVNRFQRYGLTEHSSTYYGFVMDMLAGAIMHAPTQRVYDGLEKVFKMYWYDMASAFFPGSGTFSSPSGRHYDLFSGINSKVDLWDAPIYIQSMMKPYCDQGVATIDSSPLGLCSQLTPQQVPLSTGNDDFNMIRTMQGAMQAAGMGYMPFDALYNITIMSPNRILRGIFSNTKGHEKYNFVTPDYHIGHCGEEIYGSELNNPVVARLAGTPVPGTPTTVVSPRPTKTLSYVRMGVEMGDRPFFRQSIYYIPGLLQQQNARYSIAQFQGFMLTTSFVSGKNQFRDISFYEDSWNTNIAIPLSVDAIYANNVRLPIRNGTAFAIPRDGIVTVRHQGASIVLRIIRLETSPLSYIKDAPSVMNLNDPNRYFPGRGIQEYSMTWQVDDQSIMAGSGRLVLHHKSKSKTDIAPQAWRCSTLWAAGRTPNDAAMYALQRQVRHATVQETLTFKGPWDPKDQPWYGRPVKYWDSMSTIGDAYWDTTVTVQGGPTLRVERQDTYQPRGQAALYKQPLQGPVFLSPYYMSINNRFANGKDMFNDLFDGNNFNYNAQQQAFHTVKVEEADVVQPHLTSPVECKPGVDFPCYQWRTSDWSACSVSCALGVQTRVVACVDASNADQPTNDASQCPGAVPALSQTCGQEACYPVPPVLIRVQGNNQSLTVWWDNIVDDGGSRIIGFEAIVNPGSLTVSGRNSPFTIGPLINGNSYTVQVAGTNLAGTGAYSPASYAVIPDEYVWTYSPYGTCNKPCGSGTQTRTVSCRGPLGGLALDKRWCTGLAPTDLSQACNTQVCTWSTSAWSTCTKQCASGTQTRSITCSDGITGSGVTVSAALCLTTKPISSQVCNTQACAWLIGEWNTCSKPCASGVTTRTVQCSDGLGGIATTTSCTSSVSAMPITTQACNTQACTTYQWLTRQWGTCSLKCGGGTQTRIVDCVSSTGSVVTATLCSSKPKPITQQSCNTALCTWAASGFEEPCSKPCGGGQRVRPVNCVDELGTPVPDVQCPSDGMPPVYEACNTHECEWKVATPIAGSSEWGMCSVTCGYGFQSRVVLCTDPQQNFLDVDPTFCNVLSKPLEVRPCSAARVCITPPTDSPSVLSVLPGDSKAIVSFNEVGGDNSTVGVEGYLVVAYTPGPDAGGFDLDGIARLPEFANHLTGWGTGSPVTVRGLLNGQTYTFAVLAVNTAGYSPIPTTRSAAMSPYAPPSAPSIKSVVVRGTDVIVQLNQQETQFNQPQPLYTVQAEPTEQTYSNTVSLLYLSLPKGTTYTLRVWASNPSGNSSIVFVENVVIASEPTTDPVAIIGDTDGVGASQTNLPTSIGSSDKALAIGLTVGLTLGLGLILLGVFLFVQWSKNQRMIKQNSVDQDGETYSVKNDHVTREASLREPLSPKTKALQSGATVTRRPSAFSIDVHGNVASPKGSALNANTMSSIVPPPHLSQVRNTNSNYGSAAPSTLAPINDSPAAVVLRSPSDAVLHSPLASPSSASPVAMVQQPVFSPMTNSQMGSALNGLGVHGVGVDGNGLNLSPMPSASPNAYYLTSLFPEQPPLKQNAGDGSVFAINNQMEAATTNNSK